jgi:hypothetical protein
MTRPTTAPHGPPQTSHAFHKSFRRVRRRRCPERYRLERPVAGRDSHPLKLRAFHGALLPEPHLGHLDIVQDAPHGDAGAPREVTRIGTACTMQVTNPRGTHSRNLGTPHERMPGVTFVGVSTWGEEGYAFMGHPSA